MNPVIKETDSQPMLEVKQITRRFGGLVAVNEVNFRVNHQEIFGLIGPNGAGKTTLFNLITGLIEPSSGQIFAQDQLISQLKPHQIAAKGIARTFQNIRLFGELSALENVIVGRHLHTKSK
jgi:branched-chain amino acid transport system ATP-binding protein